MTYALLMLFFGATEPQEMARFDSLQECRKRLHIMKEVNQPVMARCVRVK